MPAAKQPPAPIDRPLSRAYLREFSGWSTAYPPGLSDPTSLRLMENVCINADGSIGVRGGLRPIFEPNMWLSSSLNVQAVGSFETFFLNDGTTALLFAVRETISGAERVGFKIAKLNSGTGRYSILPIDAAVDGFTVPQGYATLAFTAATTYVRYVQIDNRVFALSDAGEPMRMFSVGSTKIAKKLEAISEPDYTTGDRLSVLQPTTAWIAGSQVTVPTAVTGSTTTLVSTTAASNVYNMAYFYTFNNEIGESASSMLTVVKVQRRWSAWTNEPTDDSKSTDQLVAIMPEAVWNSAVAQGATSWNLYMLAWSNQDSVPVEGVLLKTVSMVGKSYQQAGWASHTPLVEGLNVTMALPNAENRFNYTEPSKAAQGIVAGDRLVLVNDRTAAAVIRWSSNQQGDYSNFSASKGGGYKTLTSGNLYIPACVKLWQNPQSVDTLTVLCMGVNGESTSYYMNANTTVSGQSAATTVMGFEETTATAGTVSPYGCEVLNNALYHPLDSGLMKSTASNYNISHKWVTDPIQNKWMALRNKHKIVSSQLDNKLYFIVDNPDGIDVPEGCMGNEIWVCDTALENVWSRWLIPACSLRKITLDGRLQMAVVTPDTIYVVDEYSTQDVVNNDGVDQEAPIAWMFETNTQGANRAHDALAYLQLLTVTLGNVRGVFEYGIRGMDVHGRQLAPTKRFVAVDDSTLPERFEPFDVIDHLKIDATIMEWRFFARGSGTVRSHGQINAVQYRYAPASVNSAYALGSIETFEYGLGSSNTFNGIPVPLIDTSRP